MPKIIIDIDEKDYNRIKDIADAFDRLGLTSRAYKAIKNGTPLEDIKAEIDITARDFDKFEDSRRVRGLWIALDIIDRHMEGGYGDLIDKPEPCKAESKPQERNCQFCDDYKDGYCNVLDMKPCYPEKGCDYFNQKSITI